ncbi:MAG: hypothetical protein ABI747_00090 [Candidatus Moraniibacteriota bacterium]
MSRLASSVPEGIRKAERRFGRRSKRRNTKVHIRPAMLTALLQDPTQSFDDIGAKIGTTGERARQIYKEYYAEAFGNTRYESRAFELALRKYRAKRATLLNSERLRPFVWRASVFCVDFSPVDRFTAFCRGRRCSVHTLGKLMKPLPKDRWSYFQLRLWEAKLLENEFVLAFLAAEGLAWFLILPTSLLVEKFGEESRTIHIPFTRDQAESPHGPEQRIAWWDYEDAWHLIPPR